MIDVASYVPGTLQFSGSPLLDTLMIRYCRFVRAVIAPCRSCAVARRGFSRYQVGRPVTKAWRPRLPPNNPRRPWRRVIRIVIDVPPLESNAQSARRFTRQRKCRPEADGCLARSGAARARGGGGLVVHQDLRRLRV